MKSLSRVAWLAAAGFLLHGNWEWLQSPFYRDSATSLDRIVWFRLHCTLGDVLILVGGSLAVSALIRSDWLDQPRWKPIAALMLFATFYTAVSERRNLTAEMWSYSERMPVVPGLGVGLVPLAQWMTLSPLAVYLGARLGRRSSSVRGKATAA